MTYFIDVFLLRPGYFKIGQFYAQIINYYVYQTLRM